MKVVFIDFQGCGKTSVVRELAKLLSYRTEPVLMYQDMTARDLLQQRYTMPNGDTVWRLSPLVEAALEGGLAILDGLNRVNPGTLSILQRYTNQFAHFPKASGINVALAVAVAMATFSSKSIASNYRYYLIAIGVAYWTFRKCECFLKVKSISLYSAGH